MIAILPLIHRLPELPIGLELLLQSENHGIVGLGHFKQFFAFVVGDSKALHLGELLGYLDGALQVLLAG
jgi:hypothetical protein